MVGFFSRKAQDEGVCSVADCPDALLMFNAGKKEGVGKGRGGEGEVVVLPALNIRWCCLLALERWRELCFVNVCVDLVSQCVFCGEKGLPDP